MVFCYITLALMILILLPSFWGALQDEIRTVIALHRPTDVDTASAPALLHEEKLCHLKGSFSKSTSKFLLQ
jgi:hypothetical protein